MTATSFLCGWIKWDLMKGRRQIWSFCSPRCTLNLWCWQYMSYTKSVKELERLRLAYVTRSECVLVDDVCNMLTKESPASLRILHHELSFDHVSRDALHPGQLCADTGGSSKGLQRENLFWGVVASSFLLLRGFHFTFTLCGFILLISFSFVFKRT